MAYHLGAWWESQDGAGTEQELAAITDTAQILQVDSTDFIRVPGKYRHIAGVYVGLDATVDPRARLQSPSLDERYGRDQAFLPWINSGAEPGSPARFNDFRARPIELVAGELLRVMQVNNPAAAAGQVVVPFFADGPIQPVDPSGGFWVRATTAASAMSTGQWNLRAPTLATALRTGWYDVLAAKMQSDSAIAARFIFEGQTNRPGVLGCDDETDVPYRAFEVPGQFGVLGRFHTNNLPGTEWLVNAADNEAQQMLWYVRPASG